MFVDENGLGFVWIYPIEWVTDETKIELIEQFNPILIDLPKKFKTFDSFLKNYKKSIEYNVYDEEVWFS